MIDPRLQPKDLSIIDAELLAKVDSDGNALYMVREYDPWEPMSRVCCTEDTAGKWWIAAC